MRKIDILKKLCEGDIVKISKDQFESNGERTYYTSYFRIDKDLKILSYTEKINFGDEFDIRKDFDIESLLNHTENLINEGFTIEFMTMDEFMTEMCKKL